MKPKVLVSDDERVIADTLAIILNQHGLRHSPFTPAPMKWRWHVPFAPTSSSAT
jgi:hypothetical protein